MGSDTSDSIPTDPEPSVIPPSQSVNDVKELGKGSVPDEEGSHATEPRPLLGLLEEHHSTSKLLSEDHPSQRLPRSRSRL